MKRIKIEVEVDLDPIDQWPTRPRDYVDYIQGLLDRTIPHYNPKVTYVGETKAANNVAS